MEEQIDNILKKMKLNPDPSNVAAKDTEMDVTTEEYVQEYDVLDSALDNIDSCLSALEQQNDDLCSQIRDMLSSNQANNSEDETPSGATSCSISEASLASERNDSNSSDTVHKNESILETSSKDNSKSELADPH